MKSAESAITIRPARFGDEVGIARVHVVGWNEAYRGLIHDSFLDEREKEDRVPSWKRTIEQCAEPDSPYLLDVAETDSGEIAGFINAGRNRPVDAADGYDCEVYALYLLRSHHGQGTGAKLMRSAFAGLRARGFSGVSLWVLQTNAPGIRFYERIGGTRLAGTKHVTLGGVDYPHYWYAWKL